MWASKELIHKILVNAVIFIIWCNCSPHFSGLVKWIRYVLKLWYCSPSNLLSVTKVKWRLFWSSGWRALLVFFFPIGSFLHGSCPRICPCLPSLQNPQSRMFSNAGSLPRSTVCGQVWSQANSASRSQIPLHGCCLVALHSSTTLCPVGRPARASWTSLGLTAKD